MDNLAPWRPCLARAQHRNRSLAQARYVQLATVRPDGRPANRTIVFRGFLGESNLLQFVTDGRSPKLAQLEHCPWAEGCWYFAKTREQFRLLGRLILVTEQATNPAWILARQRTWEQLSSKAQQQFTWPCPGAPRSPSHAFQEPLPALPKPVTHFCLLLLDPTSVDHLELMANPQQRHHYEYHQGHWCSQAINP